MMRVVRMMWICLVALMPGCAGTTSVLLVPGPKTPLAEGRVDAVRDEAGNIQLTIEVKRLSEPGAIVPGATAWMVWVQGLKATDKPIAVGVLRLDQDGSGLLQTMTRLNPFGLFITAEPSGAEEQPHGEAVLSTQVRVR